MYSKLKEEILQIEDPHKAYYEICRQKYMKTISGEECDRLVDLYQKTHVVTFYEMAFTAEGKRVLDLETHFRFTEELLRKNNAKDGSAGPFSAARKRGKTAKERAAGAPLFGISPKAKTFGLQKNIGAQGGH